MKPSIIRALRFVLSGLGPIAGLAAGLAFFFGGGLIHALSGTDRVSVEVEGLIAAAGLLVLAFAAKSLEDYLDEETGPGTSKTLGEALRK